MTFYSRGKKSKSRADAMRARTGATIMRSLGVDPLDVPTSIDFVTESGLIELPPGWLFNDTPPVVSYEHVGGLRVIASEEHYPSGEGGAEEKWLHVSASRAHKIPDWDDMCRVKKAFIGEHREAVQVHPPADEYVNHHPYVLHLFCNLDRRIMPDFRKDHEQLGLTL